MVAANSKDPRPVRRILGTIKISQVEVDGKSSIEANLPKDLLLALSMLTDAQRIVVRAMAQAQAKAQAEKKKILMPSKELLLPNHVAKQG